MSDKPSTQKCGKWCDDCGKPAKWLIIETGCQAAFCDKHAKADPSFGKDDEDFKWYPIPQEKQETEHRTNVRGYNNPLDKLAQDIHRMRFKEIEQFYCDTAAELYRQGKMCRLEGSHELAHLLERAAMNTQGQQSLFAEIQAIRLFKKEE